MAAWTKMDGTMSRCYVISLSGKEGRGRRKTMAVVEGQA